MARSGCAWGAAEVSRLPLRPRGKRTMRYLRSAFAGAGASVVVSSAETLRITWKPKSFFCAPWNGSHALIHNGSKAGSGANSADAALYGNTRFGWDAWTPNASRNVYLP